MYNKIATAITYCPLEFFKGMYSWMYLQIWNHIVYDFIFLNKHYILSIGITSILLSH